MLKTLTMWITTNCGKFWKRWEYQTTFPTSWEICMQVKKQHLRTRHGTTDWFQIRKGVCQGCILSPCLFNLYAEYIMRNVGLDEAQAGMEIAGRNINNLRYADDTTLMAESKEELKSFLMKVKEEWKSWLTSQHSKNYNHWNRLGIKSSFHTMGFCTSDAISGLFFFYNTRKADWNGRRQRDSYIKGNLKEMLHWFEKGKKEKKERKKGREGRTDTIKSDAWKPALLVRISDSACREETQDHCGGAGVDLEKK